MSARFCLPMQALRIFLLQVFLLGLTGTSVCLFTPESIMQSNQNKVWVYREKGRKLASKMLGMHKETPSYQEIGQKITGQRSKIFKPTVNKKEFMSLASDDQDTLDKLIDDHLYSIQLLVGSSSIEANQKQKLQEIITGISTNMELFTSRHSAQREISQVERDEAAFNLIQQLDKAWNLLASLPGEGSQIKKYSTLIFYLNDSMVEFLIAAEKSNLIGEDALSKILNKDIGVEMICNYIWGKFPRNDFYSVVLKGDLKSSLEESPFTEELRGLLKYLTMPTTASPSDGISSWPKLVRLHLAIQIKSYRIVAKKNYQSIDQNRLTGLFFKITSNERIRKRNIKSDGFLDLLWRCSLLNVDYQSRDKDTYLIFLHQMAQFMVKYHINAEENMGILKENPVLYARIKSLDRAIMNRSDATKSMYAKYGETLQVSALGRKNQDHNKYFEDPQANEYVEPKLRYESDEEEDEDEDEDEEEENGMLIYLTNIKKTSDGSLFPPPQGGYDTQDETQDYTSGAGYASKDDAIKALVKSWEEEKEGLLHGNRSVQFNGTHSKKMADYIIELNERSEFMYILNGLLKFESDYTVARRKKIIDGIEYAPFHGNEAEFEKEHGREVAKFEKNHGRQVADYIYPNHKPGEFLYSLSKIYTQRKDPSSGKMKNFIHFASDDNYSKYMEYMNLTPQYKYNEIVKFLEYRLKTSIPKQ